MPVPARRGVMRRRGIPESVTRRRGRAFLAALVALTLLAWPIESGAVRRQRTVFLSQPPDWAPQVDEDHKTEEMRKKQRGTFP